MTGTGVSNWIRQAAIGPSLALGAFADTAYVLNRRVDELALYKRLLTAGERAWLSRNNGQGRAYTDIPAPPPPIPFRCPGSSLRLRRNYLDKVLFRRDKPHRLADMLRHHLLRPGLLPDRPCLDKLDNHLGSTSITTDAVGAKTCPEPGRRVAEMR